MEVDPYLVQYPYKTPIVSNLVLTVAIHNGNFIHPAQS